MKKSSFFLAIFCSLCPFILFAQDSKVKSPVTKFGKVNAADFVVNSPIVDSNANAVILFDEGNSELEGNTNGGFSIVFKRHCRIKLLNKNGFDAATIEIPLFKNATRDEEKLDDLKAATYNLDGGNVTVIKLESKSIFTENENKNWINKKFTFPAIKEGSIIEFSYKISSDFIFNLQPWAFQSSYPCLWSEYTTDIPDFLTYTIIPQGSLLFVENKYDVGREEEYRITDRRQMGGTLGQSQDFSIKGKIVTHRWVMKDIPSMKEESFTTAIKNYIARIEFQLSQYRFPNTPPHDIMSTWNIVSEELLNSEHLGAPINRPNVWLDDDMKNIVAGAKSKMEKAQKIYAYVRDNFTANGRAIEMSEFTSLKDIFKKRTGNVAEVNLLLIAMLRHEDIKAHPVILSTRGHGIVHPIYPLIGRYNYLICQAEIDESTVLLDASESHLGFAMLPIACYNGTARVIQKNSIQINLTSESLHETKKTTVFIANNENGISSGNYSSTLGYYESLHLRDQLTKTQKADYFKKIATEYPNEVKLENFIIDSLNYFELPATISYDMKFNFGTEDVIYFNPLFAEAMKKNPFHSAERLYPVEMPYIVNETYIFNMEIPKGYNVEELPKSTRIKLNDDDGVFEYITSVDAGKIQLMCRLEMAKANYPVDDYKTLRDFYSLVVQKQSEQIVLKKIK